MNRIKKERVSIAQQFFPIYTQIQAQYFKACRDRIPFLTAQKSLCIPYSLANCRQLKIYNEFTLQ
jgi:hypothetical protein